MPQFEQNFAPASTSAPQFGQDAANAFPQLEQNRAPGRFSVPHLGHARVITRGSPRSVVGGALRTSAVVGD
jgi:hypothetical protein